jgi:hypothetical protein
LPFHKFDDCDAIFDLVEELVERLDGAADRYIVTLGGEPAVPFAGEEVEVRVDQVRPTFADTPPHLLVAVLRGPFLDRQGLDQFRDLLGVFDSAAGDGAPVGSWWPGLWHNTRFCQVGSDLQVATAIYSSTGFPNNGASGSMGTGSA